MLKFAVLAAGLLLGASAIAADLPLVNADFEQPLAGKRVPGWSRTQHAGVRAYEISRDVDSFAHGQSSIRMRRTTEQAYGLISQTLEAADLENKLIELTASLKSAEVGSQGWIMLMTFKHHADIIDQIRAAPVTGNTTWRDVVLKRKAPPRTTSIEVGFMLLDGGTGWADHVRLRTIGNASPETGSAVKAIKRADPSVPARQR